VANVEAGVVTDDAEKLSCAMAGDLKPEGEVLPIGPGILGPTLGPCKAAMSKITPMATNTSDATSHNLVGRRLS